MDRMPLRAFPIYASAPRRGNLCRWSLVHACLFSLRACWVTGSWLWLAGFFFFLPDFLILTFHAVDTGIKGVTWALLCQLRDPAHLQQQTLSWNPQHHPDTTWTPPGHHPDTIWAPSGHQPAMKLIRMKTCIWDWAPSPERSAQICFAKFCTEQFFGRTAAMLPTETP